MVGSWRASLVEARLLSLIAPTTLKALPVRLLSRARLSWIGSTALGDGSRPAGNEWRGHS